MEPKPNNALIFYNNEITNAAKSVNQAAQQFTQTCKTLDNKLNEINFTKFNSNLLLYSFLNGLSLGIIITLLLSLLFHYLKSNKK